MWSQNKTRKDCLPCDVRFKGQWRLISIFLRAITSLTHPEMSSHSQGISMLEQKTHSVLGKGCGTPYAWWSNGAFQWLHSYAVKWGRAFRMEYVMATWLELCSIHTLPCFDAPILVFSGVLRRHCPFCVSSPPRDPSVCCCCPNPCPKIWQPRNPDEYSPTWYPQINTFQKELCNHQRPKLCEEVTLTVRSLLITGTSGKRILDLHGRLAQWEEGSRPRDLAA